jgi:hypothetical protein
MTAQVWPILFRVLVFPAVLISPQLTPAQSVFTQQGPKLVAAARLVTYVEQGASVDLSADGTTRSPGDVGVYPSD